MFTPETSKHFKKYTDESGVVSYILTTRVAPIQQGPYFTNPGMTPDGRFMWFGCTCPPSSQKFRAVIDFETDEIFVHHGTVGANNPWVLENGDVCFAYGAGIYKVSPHDTLNYTQLFDASSISRVVKDRFDKNPKGDIPNCGVNPGHLSICEADGKTALVDPLYKAFPGTRIGSVDITTGKFTEWTKVEGWICNHAAINPKNPDLGIVAEDFWVDPRDGMFHCIRTLPDGSACRIVLVTRDGGYEIVPPMFKGLTTHEWWSADGRAVYSVDMTNGLCRYDLETKTWELRVPGKAWHGHSSADEKYYVSDIDLVEENYRGCESRVRFYNFETKKDVFIVTKNPAWNDREHQNPYHMDPHPHFTCGGKYVCHTTTVDGNIDVALTPMQQLIDMTK